MNTDLVNDFIHKYSRLPKENDPDYLEMLRMTKYKVEDVPFFKPGKCANCGSSKNDGRGYINFGLEVDWYGIVYLCGTCLEDIARNTGVFEERDQKIKELEEEIESTKDLIKKGEMLPEKLVKAWEEFKEYYASLHSPGNNNSSNDATSLESDSATSKQGVIGTKQRTIKPPSIPGRKDFPSLTELIEQSEQ